MVSPDPGGGRRGEVDSASGWRIWRGSLLVSRGLRLARGSNNPRAPAGQRDPIPRGSTRQGRSHHARRVCWRASENDGNDMAVPHVSVAVEKEKEKKGKEWSGPREGDRESGPKTQN